MTRNPADYEPDELRTNLSFQCYTENLHFSFRDSPGAISNFIIFKNKRNS